MATNSVSDTYGEAYDRAEFKEERKKMMQQYTDYQDAAVSDQAATSGRQALQVGLDAVQVVVKINLEQYGGMVGWPSRFSWQNTVKFQASQVEPFDKPLHGSSPLQSAYRY